MLDEGTVIQINGKDRTIGKVTGEFVQLIDPDGNVGKINKDIEVEIKVTHDSR